MVWFSDRITYLFSQKKDEDVSIDLTKYILHVFLYVDEVLIWFDHLTSRRLNLNTIVKTILSDVSVVYDERRGVRPFPRLGYLFRGLFIPIGQPLSVTLGQCDSGAQNQAVTPAPEPAAQKTVVVFRDLPYFHGECVKCNHQFSMFSNRRDVETDKGMQSLIVCPTCGQMHT